jgi:PAS domain S-box-containing protein
MLEKVGELIKVGTWEYIPDTGQITWSKETRRILGVDDRFQASAEAFWGFVHPDDLEKIQTAFADTIENGTEYNLKVRCITTRGEHITVRTACKTRYDVYGTLVSVAGVFQDISDMGHAFDQDGFL